MSDARNASSVPHWGGGLAVRITGIVFWGLVVMGLGLAFAVVKFAERQTLGGFEASASRVQHRLQAVVSADASNHDHIYGELALVVAELDLQGARLQLGPERAIRVGSSAGPHTVVGRDLPLGGTSGIDSARLELYFPSLEGLMAESRKPLMLAMGAVFLLFGFILQWVLGRVLTRPLLGMVDTARRISEGDEAARFDERREDEFGYLAKFINRSLNFLLQQKEELSRAVARARRSEAALSREKERAVVTLHSIGDAVITTDARGRVEYFNPVAERLTGWRLDDARGRPVSEVLFMVAEASGEPLENPADRCLRKQAVVATGPSVLLRRRDGRELAIADTAAPIRNRQGEVSGVVMVFQDVTETRDMARQLSYHATHDPLTGLFNRREFERRLQDALDDSRCNDAEHILCYLDLDQFKVVNDTCGHVAGDELLRQLAALLGRQMRGQDLLARLGGDELGILLGVCSIEQAQEIAERIRRVVKEFRFTWGEHTFEIGASIGIVPINSGSDNAAAVLSAADMACYAAKDLGRNRVHVYRPDDSQLKQRHSEMRWVSRITKALDEGLFELMYQPIMPLSGEDGAHVLYEVLVRMREGDQRVPPMAFIPAAERYDLMPAIDRWVVRRVLDYMAAGGADCSGCTCAINLSGQSLGDESFLQYVLDLLDTRSVDPSRICFEITETAAVANLARAMEFIDCLHRRGCRFALDDFGSGLSSFAYLKNLDVDYLKIDGSFIRDLTVDPVDHAMVDAIVRIARVMGIRTVAEFVENGETLVALRRLGIDYVQGFHVAQPMSMDQWQPFTGIAPAHGARLSAGPR